MHIQAIQDENTIRATEKTYNTRNEPITQVIGTGHFKNHDMSCKILQQLSGHQ